MKSDQTQLALSPEDVSWPNIEVATVVVRDRDGDGVADNVDDDVQDHGFTDADFPRTNEALGEVATKTAVQWIRGSMLQQGAESLCH